MMRCSLVLCLALGGRAAVAAREPPFAVNCGVERWEGDGLDERDDGPIPHREDVSGGPILPDLPYVQGRGYGHDGGEALQAWYFGPHAGPDPRFLCGPARTGTFSYRYDIAPGRYAVQIGIFERGAHGPGVRVFDVLCGACPLFQEVDPFRHAGLFNGFRLTAIVEHPGGGLVLRFVPRTPKPAIVSLIRIFRAPEPAAQPAPARAPREVRAVGSYGRNALFWAPIEDPRVDRYEVLRADACEGPFQAIGEPRRALWAFDDVAPIGREVWYAVRAIAIDGTRGSGSAPRPAKAEPFSAVRLPLYEIEIAPAELAKLLADPTSDAEVPGRFRLRDRAWDVDVRFRGASTRHFAKKSFKVRFPQDRLFDGRRTLALKAEEADWTLLQEILSYDITRRASVLCSDAKPVTVRLNGVFLGVYTDVEFVDDAFKRRAGLDPAGLLVRLQSFLRLPPEREADAEAEPAGRPRGAVQDIDPLRRFVEALNRTDEGEFAAFLDASVDVDGLARLLAANAVMARPETEADDVFLYRDPRTGRFSWIPWDNNNGSLGIAGFSLEREWGRFSLFRQTIDDGGPEPRWTWLLWSRALRVPAFRARVLDLAERFAREILAREAIGAMIDARFAEILEDARRDVYRWPRGGIEALLRAPDVLREFARFHRERLLRAVSDARAETPALVIDEFLLRPPAGEPAWIEIRNISDRTISLDGIRVAPRIPGEAFVAVPARPLAPGQRLVVFLEGEARECARFDGGAIALVRAESPRDDREARSRVLDVLWYGRQPRGISYGRDADPPYGFAYRERPTPGDPNAPSLASGRPAAE